MPRPSGIKKTTLEELYVRQRLTTTEIAEKLGVGTSTVSRLRKKFGIKTLDRFESWVGRKFGRLVVLKEIRGSKGNPVRAFCLCDCGEQVWVTRGNLPSTSSCGCLKRESMRLAEGEASRNELLRDYKYSAARRGLMWEIDDDETIALLVQSCSYCGTPPNRVRHRRDAHGGFRFNGIDRIDASSGYLKGNVVTCCWTCNRAKGKMAVGDFLSHVTRVRERPVRLLEEEATTEHRCRLSMYRCNARYRSHRFELTEEYALILFLSPCVYCGSANAMGIDRVNNSRGYFPDNCVPCCGICNRMKSTRDLEEFFAWADRVRRHHLRNLAPRDT